MITGLEGKSVVCIGLSIENEKKVQQCLTHFCGILVGIGGFQKADYIVYEPSGNASEGMINKLKKLFKGNSFPQLIPINEFLTEYGSILEKTVTSSGAQYKDSEIKKLKTKLNDILNNLDAYSADPSTLDFEDKTVDAMIYHYPSNTGVFSKESGRIISVDEENKEEIGYSYFNAIQNLGAFITKTISRYTDYVIISKNPEETVSSNTLEMCIWEDCKSQDGEFFDWANQFRARLADYEIEIQECYVKEYSRLIKSIKKASDLRTGKKKDPQPPVRVIWEHQMYDYLIDKSAFDRDTIQLKLKLDKADGTSYMRIEPALKEGKSIDFSIYTKEGTAEETDKAIQLMEYYKTNLRDISIVEKEPEIKGNIVTMRCRSNKADVEIETEDFLKESSDVKLQRSVDMFFKIVKDIEKKMDKSKDYGTPIAKFADIKAVCKVGLEQQEQVKDFLNAIMGCMDKKDIGYDSDWSVKEITDCILQYYNEVAQKGVCYLDDCVGVRLPIGVAVAVVNYLDPFAKVSVDFAHDKWEARGDYNSGKLVAFELDGLSQKPRIVYHYYKKKGM